MISMEEQKVTSFFRFEDLRVYEKALDYYTWLLNQVRNADEFDKKTLLMPFLDTAARISMNIADGSSNQKNEFVEYLKAAKSCVSQCVVYTAIALKNNMITEQQSEESREMLVELTKMVGAMIISFTRKNYTNPHKPYREMDVDSGNELSLDSLDLNY